MRCGAIAGRATVMDAVRAHAARGGLVLGICNGFQILCESGLLPGGFSYGDYLRCGAIARFSPVMGAVAAFARAGGPVLGICNGFQVLCEAGLLPGALLRNAGLRFVCREVEVAVDSTATAWTSACPSGATLTIPVKHGEGRYVYDDPDALAAAGQVVFRYAPGHNPNGSVADIAGVTNPTGNVVGLMPHPEHAVDPLLGPVGGRWLFDSVLQALRPAGR
ncbi:MAG: phosphoribosylformylglycinamidine synthase subunit PurQ [Actinomycetes bacterium]